MPAGFGGEGANGPDNQTWTWHGNTWARQFRAISPTPRSDAAMAYDPATGKTTSP